MRACESNGIAQLLNTLLGARTFIMLQCDHMATFRAVLLSNWVALPFGKKEKYALPFHLFKFNSILFTDLQNAKIYSEIISGSGIFFTCS